MKSTSSATRAAFELAVAQLDTYKRVAAGWKDPARCRTRKPRKDRNARHAES